MSTKQTENQIAVKLAETLAAHRDFDSREPCETCDTLDAAIKALSKPVAEGASLAALQQRVDQWESAMNNLNNLACKLTEAEQRLAEVTRERDDLDKDYGVLLKESTAELRKAKDEAEENWQSVKRLMAEKLAAEATIARVRALSERWREIGNRPQRPTGFLLCADDLDAALAAPAAGTPTTDDLRQCAFCGTMKHIPTGTVCARCNTKGAAWMQRSESTGHEANNDPVSVSSPACSTVARRPADMAHGSLHGGDGPSHAVANLSTAGTPEQAAPVEQIAICERCQMRLPERLVTFGIGVRGGTAARCAACARQPGPDGEARRQEVIALRRSRSKAAAGTEPTTPAADPRDYDASPAAQIARLQHVLDYIRAHAPLPYVEAWLERRIADIRTGSVTQRLAEVTRERDDLDKDYGVLLKESTAELRKAKDEAEENWQSVKRLMAEKLAAEATIARVRALSERWREIGNRPQRPTGFLLCADDLDAALAAPAAGTQASCHALMVEPGKIRECGAVILDTRAGCFNGHPYTADRHRAAGTEPTAPAADPRDYDASPAAQIARLQHVLDYIRAHAPLPYVEAWLERRIADIRTGSVTP